MKKLKLILLLLFCTFVVSPIMHLIWNWAILFDNERAWKMFLAFDKLGNAAVNGDPAETVSERAARGTRNGSRGWCILCRLLDFFDKGHCAQFDPPVDGVRAETIHESSNEESTNDHVRPEAGVLPVRRWDSWW